MFMETVPFLHPVCVHQMVLIMRNLLFVFAALLSSFVVSAKCASNGLTVFPHGNTIAPQGIIMIEGYARSQDVINGLGKQHAVYLKSKSHTVKLLVQEVLVGEMQLTQAILKPATSLRKGETYQLHIGNLPADESLVLHNEDGTTSPISWKVADAPPKPMLTSAPKYVDQSYIEYGCGPSVYMNFMVPVHNATPFLVKATVKTENGTEHSYYIQPEADGRAQLGHGMCSGAFVFMPGIKYTASFALLAAGGELSGPTAPIAFTRNKAVADNMHIEER